ncbi:hypothetical protein NM688_g5873 [Phlebia brevispora]|uniref:Uncharacterized protein n=1 Tax=Phlebia brevispora TaxID=194682 RepID=A0ACC1SN97_9APHY|nr:hypothetical protein NM688_g5873 [Phlebia brevispora]
MASSMNTDLGNSEHSRQHDYSTWDKQVALLRELCRTSPARVVRILTSVTKPAEDDTGDLKLYARTVLVVAEFSKAGRAQPEKREIWRKLVDAGVVDALISVVIHSKHHLVTEGRLQRPEEHDPKDFQFVISPYSHAVHIMSYAAGLLAPRDTEWAPTAQDRSFISSLRAHWSDMVKRIWDEPFDSLNPDNVHAIERVAFASLFSRIIYVDPSVLNIAFNDMTIPLVTRLWASSGQQDAQGTTITLWTLFSDEIYPVTAKINKYIQEHKNSFPRSKLFSHMCLGASSMPGTTEVNQARALADVFGKRLEVMNSYVDLVLRMAQSLIAVREEGLNDQTREVFLDALVRSDMFWKGLFNLLNRAQKGEVTYNVKPIEENILVLRPILILAESCTGVEGQARGRLLVTLVKNGLWDTLDEILKDILTHKDSKQLDICSHLTQSFIAMRCKILGYCGPECQKMDWKEHKPLCKMKGCMNTIAWEVQSLLHAQIRRD